MRILIKLFTSPLIFLMGLKLMHHHVYYGFKSSVRLVKALSDDTTHKSKEISHGNTSTHQ